MVVLGQLTREGEREGREGREEGGGGEEGDWMRMQPLSSWPSLISLGGRKRGMEKQEGPGKRITWFGKGRI